MKARLLFTEGSIPLILSALNLETDYEGYVIDKETTELIEDVDGNAFKSDELIGIIKEKFITKKSQLLYILCLGSSAG